MYINGSTPSPASDVSTRTAELPVTPQSVTAQPEGELAQLQTRAANGDQLSPVDQGLLARLLDDRAAGVAPAQAADTNTATAPKTVDDFELVGANRQDRADLKAALEYLQQTGPDGKPVSQTATDLLARLPANTRIEIVHDGGDAYDPNTGTIYWDPRSALVVPDGVQSAAMGLIHEVDHKVAGLSNPQPTGDDYDNTEERRVITGSETQIAKDLGEPTRTDHRGSVTVEESSTAHSDPLDASDVVERVKEFLGRLF